MSRTVEFTIPVLPRRALASNGGSAVSHRDPWTVAEAKMALTNESEEAIRRAFAPAIPEFEGRVDILIVGHIAVHKRPKLEECARCLSEYLGEPWQGKKRKDGTRAAPSCRCYRPTDSSNLGGDVTKPIPDSLQRLGVIKNDNHKYVRRLAYELSPVARVEDEHLSVYIEEIERPEVQQ